MKLIQFFFLKLSFFLFWQQEWKAKGHPVYELIEPVDGFHPNLKAEALAADALWRILESKVPHVLGKVNPYNDIIRLLFGDQGGY